MNVRMDLSAARGPYEAMLALEKALARAVSDKSLVHLIKLRVSQINGCAFCLSMHWKEARAQGETEERLFALDAWRDSPGYTPKERAALAWAEAVTRLDRHEDGGHVGERVYAQAREVMGEEELAALTYVVATINAWNRLCIAFRSVPG
jgi:AhpD family alkylhydroperoxidase